MQGLLEGHLAQVSRRQVDMQPLSWTLHGMGHGLASQTHILGCSRRKDLAVQHVHSSQACQASSTSSDMSSSMYDLALLTLPGVASQARTSLQWSLTSWACAVRPSRPATCTWTCRPARWRRTTQPALPVALGSCTGSRAGQRLPWTTCECNSAACRLVCCALFHLMPVAMPTSVYRHDSRTDSAGKQLSETICIKRM
jgi:hypothetical protein